MRHCPFALLIVRYVRACSFLDDAGVFVSVTSIVVSGLLIPSIVSVPFASCRSEVIRGVMRVVSSAAVCIVSARIFSSSDCTTACEDAVRGIAFGMYVISPIARMSFAIHISMMSPNALIPIILFTV